MKILIMDDAPINVEGIGQYLPDFKMEVVKNFEELQTRLRTDLIDCVIMDISGKENLSAQPIQSIRRINKRAGLIVTSARDLLQEKIEALTMGADDFLTKPYDISELAARIISLVRRVNSLGQENLVYKEIRVDVDAKIVYVNDLKIDLTKKELDLLLYFLEHKNSVVKKDSLFSYLSGQVKDFKNNTDIIYAHVKNLKKKLTEAGCKTYLKTIYGIGYKWEDF